MSSTVSGGRARPLKLSSVWLAVAVLATLLALVGGQSLMWSLFQASIAAPKSPALASYSPTETPLVVGVGRTPGGPREWRTYVAVFAQLQKDLGRPVVVRYARNRPEIAELLADGKVDIAVANKIDYLSLQRKQAVTLVAAPVIKAVPDDTAVMVVAANSRFERLGELKGYRLVLTPGSLSMHTRSLQRAREPYPFETAVRWHPGRLRTTLRRSAPRTPCRPTRAFEYAGTGPAEDPATVNQYALSVWCADCHNLNIGGAEVLANEELGFKAHTERTHPAPFVGSHDGPGQCYSCHRTDLSVRNGDADPVGYGFSQPAVTGLGGTASCSQCHYGTKAYYLDRQARQSDFPHSGSATDMKLLGSYTASVATNSSYAPTFATVSVSETNLDAVCIRCHPGIGVHN